MAAEGKVQVGITLPRTDVTEMKVLAAQTGKKLQDLYEAAVKAYLVQAKVVSRG